MASLISLGQVIDKSIAHYSKHFVGLLSITAWIIVASVPAALAKLMQPYVTGTAATPLHVLTIILNYAGALLIGVVSVWALLAAIITIKEQAAGNKVDQKDTNKKAWKLFFSYIWISILTSLVLIVISIPPALGIILVMIDSTRETASALSMIGGLLLLVGSFVSFLLAVRYSILYGFAPFALALDKITGTKALMHSAKLVTGRWWGVLIAFVVPKIIYLLISFILNFLLFISLTIILFLTISDLNLYQGIGNATWMILGSMITALSIPLFVLTDFYIYDSLRNSRD